MPPKTKMTPQEVAQDVEEKKLNMGEYKDPHAVKHPGVNRDIKKITPDWQLDVPYKGVDPNDNKSI